jgi:mannose-6-phosphate isomerase
MDWQPLTLTTPTRPHAFGGTLIRDRLGRDGLPEGRIAAARCAAAPGLESIMRRVPVRAGEIVYVLGGTLHSFGPDTLVYEIEQTSNIQQHSMPWAMEDGAGVAPDQQRADIARLLEELRPEPRPSFHPGLQLPVTGHIDRVLCCAGPYFAPER